MAAHSETGCEKTYNYDEAVDLAGHGRYNQLVLLTCCILSIATALDMFGFSVVLAAGACDLQLELQQVGLLASVPFAGVFCAHPWGYYADTRGRRRALLLSAGVGFVMAACTSLAPNWQVMLVLKLFGCFFSTASFTLTMTYLGECTSSAVRNRFFMYMAAAGLSSEGIFYLIAYFILPLDFRVPIPFLSIDFRPWRLYALVLAAPLGLAVLILLGLHESPKFLASSGNNEKALEVLTAMYVANGGNKEEFQVKALTVSRSKEKQTESIWESLVEQTAPLFKPPLLWRTMQLFFLMALSCSNNNLFLIWYPVIVNQFFNSFESNSTSTVEDRNFCERVVSSINSTANHGSEYICDDTISTNTIYAGIFLGTIFAIMGLVISLLHKWRRLLLLGIYASSAACLLLTNVLRQPVINMIVFTFVQVTALCIGLVGSYFNDFYPTSHRALATSLSMMFTRVVSLVNVNVVGVILTQYCFETFYACAVYVCSGIVVSLFLPSDRKMAK